jgi:spore germination protein
MRFGFHRYHESLRERFSDHKRIYALIVMLFVSALISLGVTYVKSIPFTSFAQDTTLNPVPENYSAPLTEHAQQKKSDLKVIGFLPSWTVAQEVKVYPEYLDQIIYFGFAINKDGTIVTNDEEGNEVYELSLLSSPYFKQLKENANKTNTKILVCIKNFDNSDIENILLNPAAKRNAIAQIKKLVEEHDFDGVNVDFEYFSSPESQVMTEHNRFFQDLASEMKSLRSDMIVSADVNATVVYRDGAYDMVKIADSIDQVIIMGYDYHWAESLSAGAVAPIDAKDDNPSIRTTIDSLKGRVTTGKIVLGIPLYGYEWQTKTTDKNSETYPDTGAAATYQRVRELLAHREDLEFHYDELAQSPWLTYEQNGAIKQIYYEDEKSILRKLEFADSEELDGVALWALGYEGDYIEPWKVIKEYVHN